MHIMLPGKHGALRIRIDPAYPDTGDARRVFCLHLGVNLWITLGIVTEEMETCLRKGS